MILRPLQLIYEAGAALKNKIYDSGYIKSVVLPVPVVSVGNISLGGTGKTPCVIFLVNELLALGKYKKIVIVSRSYKGQLRHPSKVNLGLPNATSIYGDEPCLLQSVLQECSVWAGPHKTQTAQASLLAETPDLIVIDDGFSHRRLARQFDLVLIDATAPLEYYKTLPVGRLRESLSQLKRADAILVTKTNLVDEEKIRKLKAIVAENAPHLIRNVYRANSLMNIGDLVPAKNSLFVFCGLGNPESLKQSLEQLHFSIDEFRKFPDHYHYSSSELDSILTSFLEKQRLDPNLKLVTTAKDLIKIKQHAIFNSVTSVDYKLEILNKGELFEKICSHL